MTDKEKIKMRRLLEANPILSSGNRQARAIFLQTLRLVVDETYPDSPEFERVKLFGETLLEVDEIIRDIRNEDLILN